MTIAYASGVLSGSSSSGATSGGMTTAGTPSRQLLVAVFAFENVNAAGGGGTGSFAGGWVTSIGDGASLHGWERAVIQPPSVNGGNGLEVWVALWGSFVGTQPFNFDASHAYVSVGAAYTGIYDSGAASAPVSTGTIRASVSAQVTGNTPAAPSVYVYTNELVVAVGADQMSTPGFGTPTGYTNRVDTARGATFGNVEATIADALAAIEGPTGLITFPGNAAASGTKGATATLAIRPTASLPVATSPLIAVEYAAS